MIKKIGNLMIGCGSCAAILSMSGYDGSPVVCGIVVLLGISTTAAGYKLETIHRERERVNLRCRLKRKTALASLATDSTV